MQGADRCEGTCRLLFQPAAPPDHRNAAGLPSPHAPHEHALHAQGSGECTGWYVDYLHCVDGCTSKTLFKNLI